MSREPEHVSRSASIGDRVHYWRRRRGKSQRALAGLAGVSQAYVSQIETGSRPVERRSTLVALARALEVSVAELSGERLDPADPAKEKAAMAVPAIREALVMRESGERHGVPPPGLAESAMTLAVKGDVAGACAALPVLLRGCDGAELVDTAHIASFRLRNLGYVDLARDAARLCMTVARESGDPALLGVAGFAWVHSLPTETAGIAARIAGDAANELQPNIADRRVRQAYGMLHLSAALLEATGRQPAQALSHLDEATAEAASLGEPERLGLAMMGFGPTNVDIWRMTVRAELGEPDEVLRVVDKGIRPQQLDMATRQAVYHVEHGRALALVGRDEHAVLAFALAEEVAPQWVRLQPTVRDAVNTIYHRTTRGAVSRPLRRLAEAFKLPAR